MVRPGVWESRSLIRDLIPSVYCILPARWDLARCLSVHNYSTLGVHSVQQGGKIVAIRVASVGVAVAIPVEASINSGSYLKMRNLDTPLESAQAVKQGSGLGMRSFTPPERVRKSAPQPRPAGSSIAILPFLLTQSKIFQ